MHTIRYRLTKLEELTGLNLQNPEDRLTLELALRILDIAAPNPVAPREPASEPATGKEDKARAAKWAGEPSCPATPGTRTIGREPKERQMGYPRL